MYASAGHGFEPEARAGALDSFHQAACMAPRDDHRPLSTTRADERDARRRYQAAIAAAIGSLRRAEQRFDASSAAVEVHIQRALAVVSLTTPLAAVSGGESITTDVVAATLATAEPMPA